MLFPNRTIALLDFDEPDYIRCAKCLCKTCQMAYENGDAEGCGDCKRCVESKQECVRQCGDYYNYSENIIRRERGLRSKLNLYDDACEMKKGV